VGRRRFGHITGPERFLCARKRARGFRDTVTEAGADFAAHDVLYGEWSERWGREAVRVMLDGNPDADAIFCGSDQIARGVTDALRLIGKRVPEYRRECVLYVPKTYATRQGDAVRVDHRRVRKGPAPGIPAQPDQ
jgi:DNA-binding LacI/PurR family transcriptional regulator